MRNNRLSFAFASALVAGLSLFYFVNIIEADTNGTIITTVRISVCGNEVLEGGEQCDNSATGNRSCSSIGYNGGSLRCTVSCEFDTESCNTNAQKTSTATFLPSGGGSDILSEENGYISITLPPNFYSDTLLFKAFSYSYLEIAGSKPAPSGMQFATNLYDLRFFDSNGNSVHSLHQPATIIISYDESALGNIAEQSLRPYKFSTESSSWHEIADYNLDTSNNTVTFSSSSFSWFTILGSSHSNTENDNISGQSSTSGGRRLNQRWFGLILSTAKNILNNTHDIWDTQKPENQNTRGESQKPESSESAPTQMEKPNKESDGSQKDPAYDRRGKRSKESKTDSASSQLKSIVQILLMIKDILTTFIRLNGSIINSASTILFLLNPPNVLI